MLWEMEMMIIGVIGKRKNYISLLLICCILIVATPAKLNLAKQVHKGYSIAEINQIIEDLIHWKKESIGLKENENLFTNNFLQYVGTTNGDWYAIALGRLGYLDDYEAYLSLLQKNVQNRYLKEEKLDKTKATEWHRIILAMLALGGNPRDVGKDKNGNTIDLVADGTYNRGNTIDLGTQGINGYIWGLIALDSMDYVVPETAFYSREKLILKIIQCQLMDGGFSLEGMEGSADPDITAMAIQALSRYYQSKDNYSYINKGGKKVNITIKEVIDVALDSLSRTQLEDGDFASWGTQNAESTAQVLIALCTLNIDYSMDERFIKNNNTLLDGLMKYRMKDGGFTHSFERDEDNIAAIPYESNSMAGEQVLCALTALSRYLQGYQALYNFKNETVDGSLLSVLTQTSQTLVPSRITSTDEKDFLQISDTVSTKDYITVVRLLDKLQFAQNKNEYNEMEYTLKRRLEEINRREEEIEVINRKIVDTLYPFETIRIIDRKEIKQILQRLESFSDYDKEKIRGYEDLLRANTQLDNEFRSYIVAGILFLTVTIFIVILISHINSRRDKMRRKRIGFYADNNLKEEVEDDS